MRQSQYIIKISFILLVLSFMGSQTTLETADAQNATNNDNGGDHISRGVDYLNAHNTGMAIEEFTKAININPNDAAAYYNRGKAYAAKGDNDSAIYDLRKACDLGNDNACKLKEKIGFRID